MMDVSTLVQYLEATGWQKKVTGSRCVIFESAPDDTGTTLEITLPRNGAVIDGHRRVTDAINVLAAMAGETPAITVFKIRSVVMDNAQLPKDVMLNLLKGHIEALALLVKGLAAMEGSDEIAAALLQETPQDTAAIEAMLAQAGVPQAWDIAYDVREALAMHLWKHAQR